MFFRSVIISLLLCLALPAQAAVTIVASIKPLALLANELAAPDDKVELLLQGARSPHHYQLSVDNRRQLQQAQLVLWVGPSLERFLEKPLQQRQQGVIAAENLEGIRWPTIGSGHHHDDGHNHGSRDPHLWLNPENLVVITKALVEQLAALNPSAANQYQTNGQRLINRLADLDKRLVNELMVIQERPFVVLHPAYDHFVKRYGLQQLGFIAMTPERGLGARHLYQLRQLQPICVFSELGQPIKWAQSIANTTGAKVAELDPLGVNLTNDAAVDEIIAGLAMTIKQCLLKPQPAGQ